MQAFKTRIPQVSTMATPSKDDSTSAATNDPSKSSSSASTSNLPNLDPASNPTNGSPTTVPTASPTATNNNPSTANSPTGMLDTLPSKLNAVCEAIANLLPNINKTIEEIERQLDEMKQGAENGEQTDQTDLHLQEFQSRVTEAKTFLNILKPLAEYGAKDKTEIFAELEKRRQSKLREFIHNLRTRFGTCRDQFLKFKGSYDELEKIATNSIERTKASVTSSSQEVREAKQKFTNATLKMKGAIGTCRLSAGILILTLFLSVCGYISQLWTSILLVIFISVMFAAWMYQHFPAAVVVTERHTTIGKYTAQNSVENEQKNIRNLQKQMCKVKQQISEKWEDLQLVHGEIQRIKKPCGYATIKHNLEVLTVHSKRILKTLERDGEDLSSKPNEVVSDIVPGGGRNEIEVVHNVREFIEVHSYNEDSPRVASQPQTVHEDASQEESQSRRLKRPIAESGTSRKLSLVKTSSGALPIHERVHFSFNGCESKIKEGCKPIVKIAHGYKRMDIPTPPTVEKHGEQWLVAFSPVVAGCHLITITIETEIAGKIIQNERIMIENRESIQPGDEVERGPDWNEIDQQHCVGEILNVSEDDSVRVRWRDGRDGTEEEYKWGQDDSYEVQLKM